MAVGVSFAWLGVEDPSQWRTGVALYVLGCRSRISILTVFISTHVPGVPVIAYQVAETI